MPSLSTFQLSRFWVLGHWIDRLRGDSRLIVSAASAAQKASDFILGKSQNVAETVQS